MKDDEYRKRWRESFTDAEKLRALGEDVPDPTFPQAEQDAAEAQFERDVRHTYGPDAIDVGAYIASLERRVAELEAERARFDDLYAWIGTKAAELGSRMLLPPLPAVPPVDAPDGGR